MVPGIIGEGQLRQDVVRGRLERVGVGQRSEDAEIAVDPLVVRRGEKARHRVEPGRLSSVQGRDKSRQTTAQGMPDRFDVALRLEIFLGQRGVGKLTVIGAALEPFVFRQRLADKIDEVLGALDRVGQ